MTEPTPVDRRFDAPLSPRSSLRPALKRLREHPDVTLLAIGLSTLACVAAALVIVGTHAAGIALDQLAYASPVRVVLSPQTPAARTEELRGIAAALGDVARVTVVSRDDGLKALGGAWRSEGLANPLPDVLVAELRAGVAPGRDSRAEGAAERVRAALAGQPGVDSVRFDAAWMQAADRARNSASVAGPPVMGGAVLLAALLVGASWALAVRASRSRAEEGPGRGVGASMALLGALASVLLTAIIVGFLVNVSEVWTIGPVSVHAGVLSPVAPWLAGLAVGGAAFATGSAALLEQADSFS